MNSQQNQAVTQEPAKYRRIARVISPATATHCGTDRDCLEVEHLINDGAKDWSHRKGLSVAAAMLAVTALCCAGLHACYPVPPRAPAAARGNR